MGGHTTEAIASFFFAVRVVSDGEVKAYYEVVLRGCNCLFRQGGACTPYIKIFVKNFWWVLMSESQIFALLKVGLPCSPEWASFCCRRERSKERKCCLISLFIALKLGALVVDVYYFRRHSLPLLNLLCAWYRDVRYSIDDRLSGRIILLEIILYFGPGHFFFVPVSMDKGIYVHYDASSSCLGFS